MISYVSDVMIAPHMIKDEMINIVEEAQINNDRNNLTGVLFYENKHFFQIIEGEEKNLRNVFTAIENDGRHCRLTKLIDQPVPKRTFTQWSLETFYVDNPSIINPRTLRLLRELYVQNFGVSANGLLEFVEKMVNDMDDFKIAKDLEL